MWGGRCRRGDGGAVHDECAAGRAQIGRSIARTCARVATPSDDCRHGSSSMLGCKGMCSRCDGCLCAHFWAVRFGVRFGADCWCGERDGGRLRRRRSWRGGCCVRPVGDVPIFGGRCPCALRSGQRPETGSCGRLARAVKGRSRWRRATGCPGGVVPIGVSFAAGCCPVRAARRRLAASWRGMSDLSWGRDERWDWDSGAAEPCPIGCPMRCLTAGLMGIGAAWAGCSDVREVPGGHRTREPGADLVLSHDCLGGGVCIFARSNLGDTRNRSSPRGERRPVR